MNKQTDNKLKHFCYSFYDFLKEGKGNFLKQLQIENSTASILVLKFPPI